MDELTAIRDAFPAAPDPDAAMLARAQLRLDAVIRADRPRHAPWRTIALAAAAVALLLAGLATAAVATGLFDRDVTRADLHARVETVTRTMIECRAPGDCGPPHVETVKEVMGDQADGVLFIDPDGRYLQVTPAGNVVGSETASTYWRAAAGTLEYGKDRSHVEFALPDGGTRTLAWTPGQGSVDVTDRSADGTTSHTTLHSDDERREGTLEQPRSQPLGKSRVNEPDVRGRPMHQLQKIPELTHRQLLVQQRAATARLRRYRFAAPRDSLCVSPEDEPDARRGRNRPARIIVRSVRLGMEPRMFDRRTLG